MCLPELFGKVPDIQIPEAPKAPPPPPPESPVLPLMRADTELRGKPKSARDVLSAAPSGVSIGLPTMGSVGLGGAK